MRKLERTMGGAIVAEYLATLTVIFLGLCFPLIDLATVAYRCNFLVQAVHSAVHAGAVAETFSSGSSSNAAMDATAALFNKWTSKTKGISNARLLVRINATTVNNQAV